MLKEILILFGVLVVALVAWIIGTPYLQYRFYRTQGVVTSCDRLGFSIRRDLERVIYWKEKDEREFPWL